MESIAILTGGGPAPGMNTVVGSVAKTFLQKGFRVIGLHGGYSGLFNKNPKPTDIDFLLADDIFNRGGSNRPTRISKRILTSISVSKIT